MNSCRYHGVSRDLCSTILFSLGHTAFVKTLVCSSDLAANILSIQSVGVKTQGLSKAPCLTSRQQKLHAEMYTCPGSPTILIIAMDGKIAHPSRIRPHGAIHGGEVKVEEILARCIWIAPLIFQFFECSVQFLLSANAEIHLVCYRGPPVGKAASEARPGVSMQLRAH